MSAYRKGYLAEKGCREIFESWYGCYVVESRGSHGTVDLIAGNGMNTYAIQVKDEDEKPTVDWNRLMKVAELFQAIPVVAWKQRGGRWKLMTDAEDLEVSK